jgi:hypothetical protein
VRSIASSILNYWREVTKLSRKRNRNRNRNKNPETSKDVTQPESGILNHPQHIQARQNPDITSRFEKVGNDMGRCKECRTLLWLREFGTHKCISYAAPKPDGLVVSRSVGQPEPPTVPSARLLSLAGAKKQAPPSVVLSHDAWQKLDAWTLMAPGEVSGLGTVEVCENYMGLGTVFLVEDIFLLEQAATGASTVLNPAAVAKLMTEQIRAGVDTSKLKFWWHTHANMQVFFSGTDHSTIEGFEQAPWVLSLVTNKRQEYLARLDIRHPYITMEGLSVFAQRSSTGLANQLLRELVEKVKHAGIGLQRRRDEHGRFASNQTIIERGDQKRWMDQMDWEEQMLKPTDFLDS